MSSILKLSHRLILLLFVLAGTLVFATQIRAQSAEEAAKIAAKLDPDSRTVISRLSSLRQLADQPWKMHAGDIAHGESIILDDRAWETITPGKKGPNEAIWLRQTFTVPPTIDGYDPTGARVWFQMHVWANGPIPQIIYFNGRRVALGDDLEPIVLFDQAKPGDMVVIAVKLLNTVDEKNFSGATLKIDFSDNRPNPEDLRQEFLTGALLVPSLAPNDPAQMATLNSAIKAVDLKALDAHDQAKFDASLKAAHTKLEALLPLMQTATYHLTGNSHIDAAWLWPWTETVDVVKRTFGTALQLMYEYPNYTYTQSAAAYNEWLANKYPDMDAQIAKRIKEGRWEIVGGMWVEPDLNMPDGESLVRQLLVGKRYFKQHFGVDVRIGWNPDSFGYTWQLPQIYKKSGIDYFVTQKMAWNDTNQMPFKFFWWESPDGSKVLAYFPHDYANNNLNAVRLAGDLETARTHIVGQTNMMDLYGIGDHGGGPTRAILDQGEHWAESTTPPYVTPKFEFGTAQSYFNDIEKQISINSPTWNYTSIAKGFTPPIAEAGKVSIPTWKDELYFEYHRGVMTTQSNHKRNMRESEVQVLNAEKWSALAWLNGKSYPGTELTEDWKKVLFNQFHDLAAGSGIGIIYKEAQQDYDVVRWSTNEIDAAAMESLTARIDTRFSADSKTAAIPVIVWNPLGWSRTESVAVKVPAAPANTDSAAWSYNAADNTLHSAHLVSKDAASGSATYELSDVSVPALGYTVVYLQPGKSKPAEKTSAKADNGNAYTLKNSAIEVAIDKTTGCITSLVDKSGFNLIASGACGNQLQFFKDTPKDYDAWNIDPGTLDQPPATLSKADSVEPIQQNGALSAVRVTYHWQSSKFVQTISLPTNSSDQVNIDNEIDWHETHVLLKAAFPLSVSSPFATYDIPYGTIQRPTTRNNSWEIAQFEVPAMRWADYSDGKHGLSVINDTKYGYDSVGSMLRLSLLRSPVWPDPEADRGHHHFHYALYPHAGTWQDARTVLHGYNYCYPLTATATTQHFGMQQATRTGTEKSAHSYAAVSPDNVVLTAMKKAEDANGIIFRVYEWAGKDATVEFHVPAGATSATVTNMQEKPEGAPLSLTQEKDGGIVKAPIHPYEILTIRVDYPNGGKE